MTREKKLAVIWAQTHRNYKGKLGDFKTIMVLRPGGTTLVALDDLTDAEVETKWPLAMAEKARKAAKLRENAADKVIEQVYYRTCSGIQIDIMDIPKVFARGREIMEHCPGDLVTLTKGIRAYVETIRKN
jgi:hypothetical protein